MRPKSPDGIPSAAASPRIDAYARTRHQGGIRERGILDTGRVESKLTCRVVDPMCQSRADGLLLAGAGLTRTGRMPGLRVHEPISGDTR